MPLKMPRFRVTFVAAVLAGTTGVTGVYPFSRTTPQTALDKVLSPLLGIGLSNGERREHKTEIRSPERESKRGLSR